MSDSLLMGHRVICKNAVVIEKDGLRTIIQDVNRVILVDQYHGEQNFETGLWHPRWAARFDTIARVEDATGDPEFARREYGRFILRQERDVPRHAPEDWPLVEPDV